jgi:hypothetical protein
VLGRLRESQPVLLADRAAIADLIDVIELRHSAYHPAFRHGVHCPEVQVAKA